jgi:hypothetical protein
MFIDPVSDSPPLMNAPQRPLHIVRNSAIHGKGVFAARKIAAGTRIIEYEGERITARQASKRHDKKDGDPHHTFFFSLESGRVIDGDRNGNDARWINHSCAPNCEAIEEGGRVFIYALRDIRRGEELGYDYKLFLEEPHTAALKRDFACHCGAPECRGTMLVSKRKAAKKSKA